MSTNDTKIQNYCNITKAMELGEFFTYIGTALGKMMVSNGTDWVNMDGTALS